MSCCVRTCKKNKSEDTLFHFPVDIGLQTVWVNILKENNVVDPDWELTEDSQICINHFNNSCCIKTENDVLLTGEAYPSIFEVDDYLIEEIFEDGVDSMISSSYEVLNNGEEGIVINNSSDTNNSNILDKHITTLHADLDTALENDKSSAEAKKSIGKLKNISMTPKSPGPKSIDISTRIENAEDSKQKIPMFKVVPEKPGAKSDKDAGFKIVPDDATAAASPAKSTKATPANKAMQAIQIGNQFYVVSPNTPDGKELSATQLAAIKEKLLKEMNTKGPQLKKQLTIALDTPSKKTAKSPNKQPPVKKELAPKKVTTIDLNKGLPKQLKDIMSDKGKKRKLDEEAETFTVSSSLDIMPVTPAKKAKENNVLVIGSDNRIKVNDFPGNISNRNMNLILPVLTKGKVTSDETPAPEDEVPNRTEFYKFLQEVNKHIPPMNKNFWSHVYDQNQIAITKTHLVENKAPNQFLSIVIDVHLKVTIYKHSSPLSQKELSDLNVNVKEPIKTWTELKAIIDKLNLIKVTDEQSLDFGVVDANQYNNYINKAISVCKQVINHDRLGVQEHDQKIVSFITEQLSLMNESKEFRRYSINLLVFCYIMYVTSPAVYESLRKVLILPDGSVLKEMASADISREFIHASEHRMVTLASKINGFPRKDKVVVLQMYTIKVSNTSNISNVLMFVAASVCKSFAEVIYFCPTQDTLQINRVAYLSLEIIKRLENIGLQVAALVSEYNELTFTLFKQLTPQKKEKTVSITHPVDRKRKLFLLYENSSIMTAVCWDWMSKEFLLYPPLSISNRPVSTPKLQLNRATFHAVANYLKKEKIHVYFKHLNVQSISLMNQVLNKETVHVDENQKTQFALNIFQDKLIRTLEVSTNKEMSGTGEFMRIIHDWWSIVSANTKRSLLKNKFKLSISEKNREPINKLNIMAKWINIWRAQEKNQAKLSRPVFHVLSENLTGYKMLSDSMLRDYNIDQFYLGTFQVSLPADVGFVSTAATEQCKFNFK